jgi:hypothetical protein
MLEVIGTGRQTPLKIGSVGGLALTTELEEEGSTVEQFTCFSNNNKVTCKVIPSFSGIRKVRKFY